MRLKSFFILIIFIIILNWNGNVFAKYIFHYEQVIFELKIDRTLPNAQILEIIETDPVSEIYIKIKIYDNYKLISHLKDFEILINTEIMNCTKETKILEETENYIIYQIQLTKITEEGEVFIKIPANSFEDDSKNQMQETLLVTGIFV